MMTEKERAGRAAAHAVEDGMILGLGTGSTVHFTLLELKVRMDQGLRLQGVATSQRTEILARELGIPILPFSAVDRIDLTLDGADEVDPNLNGIKGGGGALLYEKLVAEASDKVIWVVDHQKMVDTLGRFPLPLEVIPFNLEKLWNKLENQGYAPRVRMQAGEPFVTDAGNRILDLHLQAILDPEGLHRELKLMSGVVETGLFLHMAEEVIEGFGDTLRHHFRK
jgi:ribose 5-phosphate isomerase A